MEGVVRLNTDGSVDTTFGADHSGSVKLSPSQGLLVHYPFAVNGNFVDIVINGSVTQVTGGGMVDSSFANAGRTDMDLAALAVVAQSDGKLLIAGSGIRRLNADGSMDQSFHAAATPGATRTAIAPRCPG